MKTLICWACFLFISLTPIFGQETEYNPEEVFGLLDQLMGTEKESPDKEITEKFESPVPLRTETPVMPEQSSDDAFRQALLIYMSLSRKSESMESRYTQSLEDCLHDFEATEGATDCKADVEDVSEESRGIDSEDDSCHEGNENSIKEPARRKGEMHEASDDSGMSGKGAMDEIGGVLDPKNREENPADSESDVHIESETICLDDIESRMELIRNKLSQLHSNIGALGEISFKEVQNQHRSIE